ncbi:hypothetical protein M2451_000595 [Dysgonomonas sp. PFB1-18]|uniref:hypothetical protein n=1 Tax=unclassified Dysgonomonas TaxID=2630389 RepID=UPI0024746E52|nr:MULTISPECIES: hypothetical protein [unclassified Dysgonomonas]MDH6307446.1 hypothetical protein [Dysgonomonas sp. PF1-14]MDH6337364.1 hypothetical protein [Dysgonomonas sp. PF1-16]MDH6379288.1 hypothetical protein [Dysgonomonas sp. PFB1-18]MDH6396074.1 hypothetical protein [Dysgonomonas sp. PF1-23]
MNKLLLIIFLAILLFSCKEKNSTQINPTEDDTEINIDSIFLMKALEDAMSKIALVKDRDFYLNKYKVNVECQEHIARDVDVEVVYGNLFSDKHKHLYVKRIPSWGSSSILDIYLAKNDRFEMLFSQEFVLEYIGDTIRDVNGDGLKDLDVWWYPSSGCCRRNVHDIYLSDAETGRLSDKYEFINPTFYPKEKIIRGVGYGYEGVLYKYKWNGTVVDTIEYIWQYADYEKPELKPQYFRISAKGDTVKIPAIPKEYLTVDDIDWLSAVLEK